MARFLDDRTPLIRGQSVSSGGGTFRGSINESPGDIPEADEKASSGGDTPSELAPWDEPTKNNLGVCNLY
jgi:hypothetical protein